MHMTIIRIERADVVFEDGLVRITAEDSMGRGEISFLRRRENAARVGDVLDVIADVVVDDRAAATA